ncbi:threonine/serine dehydratase [Octadecabacter sp. G9-8]|uniref:Threonine/serine dehydratase n=1 Tax=Octadecabacter dasysiphoniae TaxID=2909341 RepID=A0ABS9CUW6_9RHOB|nr:threonine/serine dehydratase [Octadecabacter dasysiphoniae]MCF2870857.1 threonine/serine dehydratase [Octadecabacter dasysiphoniae]
MNIDMIRAAATRLHGFARRTPLLSSPFLDDIAGRRVYVKPECLQHTGSFKFRGAWSALSALDPDVRARGVIAFSSGNHAQGVALAAARHNTTSVIIMPADAPQLKIDNTRALGAEVILYDRDHEDRDDIGARLSAQRGLTLIKPFDNEQVIAGQGTTGLEIAQDANELGLQNADVLVCCGGGGLTSGIALACDADAPTLRVRPVEPEGFDDVKRSLETGTIQTNTHTSGNICDAIITPQPGDLTFPIMKRLCGPALTISEQDALHAMAHAFLRLKLVAEPGGAAALAAALFRKHDIKGDAVIVTISGGNVDPAQFAQALDTLR